MNEMTAAFDPRQPGSASRPGMRAKICESDFPLAAIPPEGDFGLAVITGIEGAAYRPVGAAMVIDAGGDDKPALALRLLDRLAVGALALANLVPILFWGRVEAWVAGVTRGVQIAGR